LNHSIRAWSIDENRSMPLTLEQYANYLDTRELPWPAPPTAQPPRARPKLTAMPNVRLITWNIYGTLLAIPTGSLLFEHPQKFVMEIALDKTVQEFKMWGSMYRKPGQPSEYLREMYQRVMDEQKLAPSIGEKYPEILAEKIWEGIVKKLLQKDYKFDTGFYGSLNEYSRKIAYFFHASLQGTAAYPGAAQALEHVRSLGLPQGLIADAQCFTLVQLQRGLAWDGGTVAALDLFDRSLCALSHELGGRKPSERLFKHVLLAAQQQGLVPAQILHVGSRLVQDLGPAKKLGMRTALFAGDKESLQATPEQLKDPAARPDALLTELGQIAEIVGS
jgi:FMN phosphatase YigB (HAD superfamily)